MSPTVTVLVVALVMSIVTAIAASIVTRLSARSGGIGSCLAGQMGALALRLAGLVATAFLVHARWPAELVVGLGAAGGVMLVGLVLDVRHLLRTVRNPAEERVRA